MGPRSRLFLIDGHALAYRTYFALTSVGGGSRWMTKQGEPTAGTYGFTSVLLRLLEQESPEYLAVSFDTGRTFRDDLYPEYKATREKMPDDLRLQLQRIREVVSAFGIPILEAEGYEADDVLGTIAHQASSEGVQVVILTGDRDLLQLVEDNIHVRLAGQKLSAAVDFGPDEVREKYALRPSQLIDLKAIVGDASDNIPGVHGVGEKTAVKLLQEYGDLDSIYVHLDEIPARFRSKLDEGKDSAYLSRELGKIVTDVPLEFDLEACRAAGYNRDNLTDLFRELEFRSLLDRIPAGEGTTPGAQLSLFISESGSAQEAPSKVVIVDDPDSLKALQNELSKAEAIAFDVETTDTDAMIADLVGISLSTRPGVGYYLPVGHEPAHAGGAQLDLETVVEHLRPALTDARVPKFGHNLKYDYIVLARHGLRATPLAFDTMIAEWLCDPSSRNLGLKNLAFVRLGIEMIEIGTLIGTGKNQRSMSEVPIAEAAPYAAADAEVCLQLHPRLRDELREKGQFELFETLEMPLVPVLAEMEMNGIALDTAYLSGLSGDMEKRIGKIEADIFQLAGHAFNINSTQQLSVVLFDELGLDPPDRTRKTASGHYSTAASVLDELHDAHPIITLLLEYREITKLKSTYTDSLKKKVNPVTQRVHTSYNQTGSVTGRLASSDPNLQNIPIRTDMGRMIRGAFVPAPGHLLLSVDYSQIELRIVAHVSQDRSMIQAFLDDQDIHTATAAAIFRVEPQEVDPRMRRQAKAVNFGLLYGMTAFGLSRTTDLTLAEAEDFVNAYFEQFPGVRQYLEHTRLQASETGFVTTLLGRRRYFPQLAQGASVPEVVRARATREAINAPIQGTAADIIKLAMIRMPDALQEADLDVKMLLQVHDELVFECPSGEIRTSAEVIQRVMRNVYQLDVPLKTDAKAGANWAELSPLE